MFRVLSLRIYTATYFFCSNRRRHPRCYRDWSSDVCSSDLQSALDFYNELLKKSNNSEMARDLQHQQEGEQFRVLDPPSLPDKPSFPKKTYFLGGGLGAGFALGVGILALIAFNDRSIYTERDVERCLQLPVLGLIPKLKVDAITEKSTLGTENGYLPFSTRA